MPKQSVAIQIERKTFPFEIKSFDESQGIIKGYLAVFNNVDSDKDRIRYGAFKKTISEGLERKTSKGRKFLWPVLFMHEIDKPIGGFIDAIEDKTGLLVTAQIDITTNEAGIPLNPLAMSVYSGMKMGYITEMSVGYKAIQKSYGAGGIRDLTEMQVFEGSAVVQNFASNEDALISQVKSMNTMSRKGKTMTQKLETKDFNDRYREECIKDWMYTDFQNLVVALQSALMDIFKIGDEPQIDVLNTILNGSGEGSDDPGNKVGFIQAVQDYVQKGIDLDVSNYLSDNSGSVYDRYSYSYMARSGDLETKKGATVSKDSAARLGNHVDTLALVTKAITTVAEDMALYITGGPAFADEGDDPDNTAPNKDTSVKTATHRPLNAPNNDQPLNTGDDEFTAELAAFLAQELINKAA